LHCNFICCAAVQGHLLRCGAGQLTAAVCGNHQVATWFSHHGYSIDFDTFYLRSLEADCWLWTAGCLRRLGIMPGIVVCQVYQALHQGALASNCSSQESERGQYKPETITDNIQ
jgi:hypothetical protein